MCDRPSGVRPDDRRSLYAAVFAAAIALGAGVVLTTWGTDFCLDDAWIHLSYAKSLRLGEGLSYNPHDWETGFSSPAWVLLLSLFPIGESPVLVAKLLGVSLHAATAFLAARVARKLAGEYTTGRPSDAAFVAGFLVALHPLLVRGSVSGMEVSLTAAVLLLFVLSTLEARTWLSVVAGFLAAGCRVEALPFLAVLSLGLAWSSRSRRPLAGLAGALCALGTWVLYCLVVSGYPWPNARYSKEVGLRLDSLGYLTVQVLPSEPWLWSVGGAILLGAALFAFARGRRWPPILLLGAWAVALLGVASSRRLESTVLFFSLRYFAPFVTIPPILAALGLGRVSSKITRTFWVGCALLGTTVAAVGVIPRVWQDESGIETLHTRMAYDVRARIPADAVVAVEGAGALRFFTPRTMRILDVMGLNDRRVAHAADAAAKMCVVAARHPDYFVLPDELVRPFSRAFELRPLTQRTVPDYAQTAEPRRRDVFLFERTGDRVDPERCRRYSVNRSARP